MTAMHVKLVVVAGAAKTKEIRLRLPAVLGRGRACSVQLPHPLVSRQHCEVYEADSKLFVRDLGSLNGTLVNGQKVTEAEVQLGQLLTIGSLTFRLDASEAPPDSTPRKRPPVTATATVPTPQAAVTLRPTSTPTVLPGALAATPTIGDASAAAPAALPLANAVPPQVPVALPLASAAPPLPVPPAPTPELDDHATQAAPPDLAPPAPETVEFGDALPADEAPSEDQVEVIDDAADLLPPAAGGPPLPVPLPNEATAAVATTVPPYVPPVAPPVPWVPAAASPTAGPPVALAPPGAAPPLAVPPAAEPPATEMAATEPAATEPAATEPAATDDDDLTAFLKSLGR
ncbi:MAG: FHA domain-containing protein [Pirellulales bacterium]